MRETVFWCHVRASSLEEPAGVDYEVEVTNTGTRSGAVSVLAYVASDVRCVLCVCVCILSQLSS